MIVAKADAAVPNGEGFGRFGADTATDVGGAEGQNIAGTVEGLDQACDLLDDEAMVVGDAGLPEDAGVQHAPEHALFGNEEEEEFGEVAQGFLREGPVPDNGLGIALTWGGVILHCGSPMGRCTVRCYEVLGAGADLEGEQEGFGVEVEATDEVADDGPEEVAAGIVFRLSEALFGVQGQADLLEGEEGVGAAEGGVSVEVEADVGAGDKPGLHAFGEMGPGALADEVDGGGLVQVGDGAERREELGLERIAFHRQGDCAH